MMNNEMKIEAYVHAAQLKKIFIKEIRQKGQSDHHYKIKPTIKK